MSDLDELLVDARILAMKSVLKPDGEYYLRRICRWYSHTFATPLHVVELEVPVEYLLRAFYEARYEDMEEEERDHELEDLLLTPAQRLAKEKEEEQAKADDNAFLEQERQAAVQAQTQNPALKSLDRPPGEQEPIIPIPVMGTSPPLNEAALEQQPPITSIPEGISMQFVDPGTFEEMDDWDVVGPMPAPPPTTK